MTKSQGNDRATLLALPALCSDNTLMLFGEAKQSVTKLLTALRA